MDNMVRPVQYARTLNGRLVAVEQGPFSGFAIGDEVYATSAEANTAAGKINQQCFLNEQINDMQNALWSMIDAYGPFHEYREKYDQYERTTDLVEEIINALFPKYGSRNGYANEFAATFQTANDIFTEMKG